MERGMEQEDEDEFVEEPMSADFDVGSINDPIAIDEPANHEVDVKPSTVNSAGIDLDLLFNDYSDYALMNRLLFIADVCPPLKVDALKMLIDYVLKRVDSAKASGIHGTESIPELDKTWVDVTTVKANSRLEAFLVEFKRQKDEAVKESIRRALEDVFHQYVQMGNLQEALKLYGRGMREYCTAPNQVIQMLINWINVTVYAEQWSKLSVLLPQAERAIVEIMERENTPTSATLANPYTQLQMTGKSGNKNQKEFVLSSKAKLLAVSGLANLQDKKFKEAAEKFMLVDLDVLNYPQLLSASDVAVYGVMFCKSQFGACLDILHDLRDQLLLNIYLAPHINVLYTSIRQSAIIQYFDSYFTADINQMATEFRTTAEQMESELVTLIERGQLKAKIDSYNKVLHAKFSDNRTDIYNRIMALRKRLDHRINAILLRAAILNHRIYEQK
uniref:PCI domain-containing protein n=1 Tax=Globodera pallida TaxID=36090 RepID=A0A183BSZ3_GLOPA